MITDKVFNQLKAIQTNLTENEFAKSYLCTSRSYLCNRRNNNKDVSNDVALNLYCVLIKKANQWKVSASRESVIQYRLRWDQLSDHYLSLAGELAEIILKRAEHN
ncbi:MAG: Uncharacterised protein [Porticoccaceae bacterium UBA1117]|nr:MAG: Uncharacterised protein [Porticoccaceae bacterium UBA1117]